MTFSVDTQAVERRPAPEPLPRITRRRLHLALGGLWLLDGVLQLQPYMLSHRFSSDVLIPAAAGQPWVVTAAVRVVAHGVAAAPVPADVLFALVQLGLGAAFLWRRTARWAVRLGIAWPLAVWYLGEGLGDILGGHASLLTGAPGAALIYAVVAAAAWIGRDDADFDAPPSRLVLVGWAAIWGVAATLQADNARSLASTFSDAAGGSPAWLSGADQALAHWVAGSGPVAVTLIILAEVVAALLLFAPGRWALAGAGLGAALALATWALGQGFGLLFSGQSTDPNSGPLLVLMAVAAYGAVREAPAYLRSPGEHARSDLRSALVVGTPASA